MFQPPKLPINYRGKFPTQTNFLKQYTYADFFAISQNEWRDDFCCPCKFFYFFPLVSFCPNFFILFLLNMKKKLLFLKSDNPKHFSFIVFDFKFPSAPLGYYIFKNFLTSSFIPNSPPFITTSLQFGTQEQSSKYLNGWLCRSFYILPSITCILYFVA